MKHAKIIDGITYYFSIGKIKSFSDRIYLQNSGTNEKQFYPDGSIRIQTFNKGDSAVEYLSNGYINKIIVNKDDFNHKINFYILNDLLMTTITNPLTYGEEFYIFNDNKKNIAFHYSSSKILEGYTTYFNNTEQYFAINNNEDNITVKYPNGNIMVTIPLKLRLMEGMLQVNHENGKSFIQMDFEGGFIKSKMNVWNNQGQILIAENKFLGEMHGNQEYYDNDGLLINIIPYYYGEFQGKYISNTNNNTKFEFIIE